MVNYYLDFANLIEKAEFFKHMVENMTFWLKTESCFKVFSQFLKNTTGRHLDVETREVVFQEYRKFLWGFLHSTSIEMKPGSVKMRLQEYMKVTFEEPDRKIIKWVLEAT